MNFETAWIKFINSNHSDILDTIRKEGEISPALEDKLGSICESYVESFTA